MRVFAKADRTYNDFKNINIASAALGFREFGIEVIKYHNMKDIMDIHEYGDICLDGVGQVRYMYNHYDIETPDYGYPEVLKDFYGRTFWNSTLNTVYGDSKQWGILIKPVENKLFTGKVVNSLKDFVGLGNAYEDIPIICSDVVNIQAEWRGFIRYDKLIDIRPYNGDWRKSFDPKVIEEVLVKFKEWQDRPNGCSIDFGVTDKGQTIVIEVNDGYALGSYGLQPLNYAKLISARSSQLYGIKDDLITVQDIVESY